MLEKRKGFKAYNLEEDWKESSDRIKMAARHPSTTGNLSEPGFYECTPGSRDYKPLTGICFVFSNGRGKTIAKFLDGSTQSVSETASGAIHPNTLERVDNEDLKKYVKLAKFIAGLSSDPKVRAEYAPDCAYLLSPHMDLLKG